MKPRDLIAYSMIFLICIVLTSDIVNYQLTGNHIFVNKSSVSFADSAERCKTQAIQVRDSTNDPQLKSLPEYEKACDSSFVSNMMLFTNMPISVPNAQTYADKMAIRLKEFDKQQISPIVVAEPDSDWGLIDFQEFSRGDYDAWIAAYFQQLKADGVTDNMLGIWIPFPEPQQPYWNNNSNPDDFAHCINRYLGSLRKVFPKAQTGILLDSQATSGDQAPQLLAYTRLIDNSLVDVAGLQGFPWNPPTAEDKRKPITSASVFAPASLLQEVANSLNTKKVLFNIGTYRHRKIDNGGDISITLEDRKKTLDSISHEANLLTTRNYKVIVNIFAQNKYNDKEGIDWSYWDSGNYKNSQQTILFTHFVKTLIDERSSISLFDSRG
jgi:hypothetical protein